MDIARPNWTVADLPLPNVGTTPERRAALTLLAALVTGALTQALFWRTGFGLNFFLWSMLAVLACLASVRPRRLNVTGYGAIAAVVLESFAVFRFAGEWTVTIAVPSVLILLAVLPLALRDEVPLSHVADLPIAAVRSLKGTKRAAREAARIPNEALGGRHAALLSVLKGLAVGLPVTGVFVVLLSADVDFAHVLERIEDKLGEGASFAAWTLFTAAGGLFTHVLHQRVAPNPMTDAKEMLGPFRQWPADARSPMGRTAARVAVSTWLMVVGQVALVFALFVAVNLRNLFGGDALVRAPGSMTYAKYLHAGFGQLLFAAILSVCLVAVGHRWLRPRTPDGAEGAVPGGRLLKAVECSLLGLTAVTVLSCAQRLAIYQDAYGASRLRLGVAFVILTVLCALGLTAFKVVRRGWRGYGGALASAFVALSVIATAVNADAYVARANLDRAARGKPLDQSYLASLSVDARGVLDHPVVTKDPGLHAMLTDAYCPDRSHKDWRAFRGIGTCGR